MIKKILLGLLPLLLLCTACDNKGVSNSDDLIPVSDVQCNVIWRESVFTDSNQLMSIKDGVLYFAEKFNGGAIAINANSGNMLWKDHSRAYLVSNPLFFEDGKVGYFSETSDREKFELYIYDSNGSFGKKVVCLGEEYIQQMFTAHTNGNDLYWNAHGLGLATINIESEMTYNSENDEWEVIPEIIYPWIDENEEEDNDGVRYRTPVILDNILYSAFQPKANDTGTFFAVDLSTKEVLWENSDTDLYGSTGNPMYLRNDKLIALDKRGYGILDPFTGIFDVEIAGLDKPLLSSSAGGFFYNDNVYFTNINSSTWDEDNIFCLDEETGELIWSKSRPSSHGSNPVVHEGIVYIAMQSSIDLFNSETGEYLGSDESLRGDEWQLCNVLTYNDTMIFRNLEEVICIKMDFRLNDQGQLCQLVEEDEL